VNALLVGRGGGKENLSKKMFKIKVFKEEIS
jgi:hypothetical protein